MGHGCVVVTEQMHPRSRDWVMGASQYLRATTSWAAYACPHVHVVLAVVTIVATWAPPVDGLSPRPRLHRRQVLEASVTRRSHHGHWAETRRRVADQ